MQKYFNFLKKFKTSLNTKLATGFDALNKKEVLVVYLCTFLALISLVVILIKVNDKISIEVPEEGGSVVEGIIGTPTLINPVLAVSPADKDMVALVYSGLMRKDQNGEFINDLAESINISNGGTKYTFKIKDTAKFQDGKNVTADDVIFTINKIRDPLIKSPESVKWEGIEIIKENDMTVSFILKQPFVSFLDNMTLGVLPMHIWKNISTSEFGLSSLNIKAIGSGPYIIKSVSKNVDGVPKSYTLKSFKKFVLAKPHIDEIKIVSYPNEKDLVEALKDGDIDQAGGISPLNAESIEKQDINIETTILPRMFGLFFNSSKNPIFKDRTIINAINLGINRERIVTEVLYGYGKTITTPVPGEFIKNSFEIKNLNTQKEENLTKAKNILENSGYVLNQNGIYAKTNFKTITTGKGKNKKTTKVATGTGETLRFSLTTGDAPELRKSATIIQDEMKSLGIEVELKIYETGQLNQIIRERDYEALFFGEVVNHESDLYAYWHSSQVKDPGLNIALYINKTVDSLLESVQKNLDEEDRSKKYLQFVDIFSKDIPAIFIYSPEYIYASHNKIKHFSGPSITTPQDRFSSVYTWYTNTDKVWKIFSN